MTFRSWIGQVTTGIGVLIATPAALGYLSHQMTLGQAAPLFAASLVGLVWPENRALATSGQTVVSDLESFVPLLLTALAKHSQSTTTQPSASAPPNP